MLQALVKTVGANVNVMEEHLVQAEGEMGTLPGAFKKILRTMSVPGFLNVRAPCITHHHMSAPKCWMFLCGWGHSASWLSPSDAVFAVVLQVVTLCLFTRRNQPAREDRRRISVTRFQACSGQMITSRRSQTNDERGRLKRKQYNSVLTSEASHLWRLFYCLPSLDCGAVATMKQ